ncbi:MAG: hypothetical protein Q3960_00650 [Lactobacillus sp.]|nr:hypothetical protein [Lactobacillus sp.]
MDLIFLTIIFALILFIAGVMIWAFFSALLYLLPFLLVIGLILFFVARYRVRRFWKQFEKDTEVEDDDDFEEKPRKKARNVETKDVD